MRGLRTVHLSAALTMIALIALVGGTAAACGSSSSASTTSSSAQSSGGAVQFISIDEFDVADYAGAPLVINYFGSWCGPCNMEAPELASWARNHPDAQFVGIAVDDTEETVTAFMDEYGLTYPVVLDPDWSNANENGVSGVPTTVFYNARGQEVDRMIGALTEAQLDLSYAKAGQ